MNDVVRYTRHSIYDNDILFDGVLMSTFEVINALNKQAALIVELTPKDKDF